MTANTSTTLLILLALLIFVATPIYGFHFAKQKDKQSYSAWVKYSGRADLTFEEWRSIKWMLRNRN